MAPTISYLSASTAVVSSISGAYIISSSIASGPGSTFASTLYIRPDIFSTTFGTLTLNSFSYVGLALTPSGTIISTDSTLVYVTTAAINTILTTGIHYDYYALTWSGLNSTTGAYGAGISPALIKTVPRTGSDLIIPSVVTTTSALYNVNTASNKMFYWNPGQVPIYAIWSVTVAETVYDPTGLSPYTFTFAQQITPTYSGWDTLNLLTPINYVN